MYLISEKREMIINYIRPRLTEKRFTHTLGTEKMAVRLAERCGADVAAAQTAALLHDSYKCISPEERASLIKKYEISTAGIDGFGTDIVHGYIAACAVKEDLRIYDEDILNAIAYHTTGRPGMSRLEKIIYSADVVEENRVYDVVDYLRKSVYEDIDSGTYTVINHVLQYLLVNDKPICGLTVETYNSMLKERNQKENANV